MTRGLTGGIKGQTRSIRRKKLATAEAGRVCEWDECETRLTIYNTRPTCYLHTPKRVPRIRGRDSDKAIALGLGVDTSVRCYMCAISLTDFGEEAVEIQGADGDWHWWVKVRTETKLPSTTLVKLCKVQ